MSTAPIPVTLGGIGAEGRPWRGGASRAASASSAPAQEGECKATWNRFQDCRVSRRDSSSEVSFWRSRAMIPLLLGLGFRASGFEFGASC